MQHSTIPLTASEALSGIFGSISLAAWIFLLVPQLVENYRQQSAQGISLLFLTVWAIGDVANLSGSIWARLVPTVTLLAVYFCFADGVLILQCLYYNRRTERARKESLAQGIPEQDDNEPLLARRGSAAEEDFAYDAIGLPGSHHRRKSSAASRRSQRMNRQDPLVKAVDEPLAHESSTSREALKNIACVLLICIVGAAGWAIAWRTGVWQPSPAPGSATKTTLKDKTPIGAEILGYFSAVCYLGARIPQIVKNWREKSCDGLSLLFFLLSVLGNLTYGAGILFHSQEKKYILTNLPWLIGSLGTMVEDVMIFVQFHMYGDGKKEEALLDEA